MTMTQTQAEEIMDRYRDAISRVGASALNAPNWWNSGWIKELAEADQSAYGPTRRFQFSDGSAICISKGKAWVGIHRDRAKDAANEAASFEGDDSVGVPFRQSLAYRVMFERLPNLLFGPVWTQPRA